MGSAAILRIISGTFKGTNGFVHPSKIACMEQCKALREKLAVKRQSAFYNELLIALEQAQYTAVQQRYT